MSVAFGFAIDPSVDGTMPNPAPSIPWDDEVRSRHREAISDFSCRKQRHPSDCRRRRSLGKIHQSRQPRARCRRLPLALSLHSWHEKEAILRSRLHRHWARHISCELQHAPDSCFGKTRPPQIRSEQIPLRARDRLARWPDHRQRSRASKERMNPKPASSMQNASARTDDGRSKSWPMQVYLC